MKTHNVSIETGKDGYTLSGMLSAPDEAGPGGMEQTLVIMLHDFPFSRSDDHADFYGYLRNIFDANGLHTLTYDFQSCGDSEGVEEEFTLDTARENLKDVLQWAKLQRFDRFLLVACGAAAALALEHADKTTAALLLFWPVADLALHSQRLFYQFAKGGQEKVLFAAGRKIGHDLVTQMENYDMKALEKTVKIPVLIQYGAQDDVAGTEQADHIKARFKALRIDITSYADGGYGLTDARHRKMIAHHIGQFLHKYA